MASMRTEARAAYLVLLAAMFLGLQSEVAGGQVSIRGEVRASIGDSLLSGVEVVLPGLDLRITTGPDGRFAFNDVPPGPVRVLARRIGYHPVDLIHVVPDRRSVTLELRMNVQPVALPHVEVTADFARHRLWMAEFEQRRKMGFGRFLRREGLERFDGRDLVSLLRDHNMYQFSRRGVTSFGGRCPIRYFVDGLPLAMTGADLRSIQIRDIEGIEMYHGPATVPVMFEGGSAGCGVVAIWLRRG